MKNSKRLLILILLASLALGLAACGGEPEPTAAPQAEPATATPVPATNTPVPTATPEPTAAPEPTTAAEPTTATEPEPGAEAEVLNLGEIGTPSDLTSYRASMSISVSGTDQGEPVDGSMTFLIEYTSEPLAQHLVMTTEGLEETETESMEGIEMYQLEDTTYLKLGEQWLSVPATEETSVASGFVQPGDVLADTCGWKKERDTEYNGIMAHHWTASKEAMTACMTAAQLSDMGDITAASGDLYIAVEGSYVLQMSIVFEGQDLQAVLGTEDQVLDEGRMEFTYGMSDVNEPFTIEVPAEALSSSSLPEDIPFPDDAQEVANAFGMITFNSPSTAAEVADFYKAAMPQNGWTEVSELSGLFMMEYSKDGRTASLMISSDEDTELTSVLLTIQEEEG
jgi:hypothetical protein